MFFIYDNKAVSLNNVMEVIWDESAKQHTRDGKKYYLYSGYVSVNYFNGQNVCFRVEDKNMPGFTKDLFDNIMARLSEE